MRETRYLVMPQSGTIEPMRPMAKITISSEVDRAYRGASRLSRTWGPRIRIRKGISSAAGRWAYVV